MQIRIQGFDDQTKQNTAEIFSFLLGSKVAIYLSIASIKDVQATGEPQPSKENKVIQHFKSRNFITVFYFPGPFFPSWIRIRIKNPDTDPGTLLNPDPIRIHNAAFKLWIC
jgi:hypothetical protein